MVIRLDSVSIYAAYDFLVKILDVGISVQGLVSNQLVEKLLDLSLMVF
jgi:hypothetical protein